MTATESIKPFQERASQSLPRLSPLHLGEGPTPFEPPDDHTDPLMIRDLPVDLRPRERLIYAGAGALSTAELLAIILRVGGRGENVIRLAERLLSTFGGVAGLAQASFDELRATHGVGEAKAAQIKAALELGKRLLLAGPQERLQIRSPTDVANLLMMEMGLLEQEQLRVVLLDTKAAFCAANQVGMLTPHSQGNTCLNKVGTM